MAKKDKVKPLIKQAKEKQPIDLQVTRELDRISSMTDYSSSLDQLSIKGMYAYYGSLSPETLTELLKDNTLSALSRTVITTFALASLKNKNSLQAIQYIHDRTFGKVEQKLELSGKNGKPIELGITKREEFKGKLKSLSKEELAELKSTIKTVGDILGDKQDGTK